MNPESLKSEALSLGVLALPTRQKRRQNNGAAYLKTETVKIRPLSPFHNPKEPPWLKYD